MGGGGITSFLYEGAQMWQAGVNSSVLKHETPFKNYATRLARKEGGGGGYSPTSMNHSTNTFWSRKSETGREERSLEGLVGYSKTYSELLSVAKLVYLRNNKSLTQPKALKVRAASLWFCG